MTFILIDRAAETFLAVIARCGKIFMIIVVNKRIMSDVVIPREHAVRQPGIIYYFLHPVGHGVFFFRLSARACVVNEITCEKRISDISVCVLLSRVFRNALIQKIQIFKSWIILRVGVPQHRIASVSDKLWRNADTRFTIRNETRIFYLQRYGNVLAVACRG